jgi:hypothetical protein
MSTAGASVTFPAFRIDHRFEIISLDAIRTSDDVPRSMLLFLWKV